MSFLQLAAEKKTPFLVQLKTISALVTYFGTTSVNNHFRDLNFVPFLITGAASLNAKMNGMIAMRTIIYFLVTSLLSAIIGLILVLLIHPGNPETKAELGNGNTEARQVDIVDNFMDLGRNLFPDNMFKASFQTVTTYSQSFFSWPFCWSRGYREKVREVQEV